MSSDPTQKTDGGEQARLWNGAAGRAWVETQDVLEQTFQPFEDLLVEAVRMRSGSNVLDVGCGTGNVTLAVARLLGDKGHCTGIDISDPMIAAATARSEREGTRARFVCANAQSYEFEPASFDTIVSRFGVMFFDNPVEAFQNLRRASKADAALRFLAWRSAAENSFMTAAERVAAPVLPNLPARKPGAPGQFAFADQHRVRSILEESGWDEVDIQPIEVTCAFPAADLERYFTRIGPVGLALQEIPDEERVRVVEIVRTAFDDFVDGVEVRFTAACWDVRALNACC